MKNQFRYRLLFFLLPLVLQGCSKTIEGDLIITNVNIIDVKTGNINSSMDVALSDDIINSIVEHKSNTIYKAETIVDGSEKYLLPGLWDMHTHTWWAYQDFFPLLIANGVTGIREMFGDLETVKLIRTEIENGDIVGPMIYSSGPIVDGEPAMWPGSEEASTPEKGRDIVRKQKEAGADFIKVYSFLDKDVYLAIVDECKKQDIPFSGHIPTKVTLEEAIIAGQHSIEHFYGIPEFMSSKKEYYYKHQNGVIEDTTLNSYPDQQGFLARTFDERRIDSLITVLAGKKTWINPTSTVNRAFAYINDSEFRNDNRINYMPDYAITNWDPKEDFRLKYATDKDFENERSWYNNTLSIMKPMLDGGIKFLAGTDYPNPYTFPGFSLHDELQIFVEKAGFSNLEALQTATINPAIFMGKEAEFGTVEMDKLANLIILDKNPLDDINNTRSINSVIVSGQYFEGQKLRDDIEKIVQQNKLPKIKDVVLQKIEDEGIEAAISEYHSLKKIHSDAYNFNVGQLNSLGYHLLSKGKISEAIAVFKLNTEMFPEDGNTFDSLGDAYIVNKDTISAIRTYNTAVSKGFNASKPKIEALQEK